MGVSFGMGGSQKDQTGNTRNYFLGDADGWSPSLDMVYRLSDMANQSNAQSNLMFGGAGYGGSFETESQRAARAAGTTENSKPYGGWGGYGSTSPVQYWDPSGTRPDWNGGQPVYPGQNTGIVPPPVTGGPPVVINDPADPNPPPRTGGTTPTWPQPGTPGGVPLPGQPGGPALPPRHAVWTPEGGYTISVGQQQSAPVPQGGSAGYSQGATTGAPREINDPKKFPMADMRQRKDTPGWWEAEAAKLPSGSDAQKRYMAEAQLRRDPGVQQVYKSMIEAGWPTGKLIPADRLKQALDSGVAPQTLATHYNTALQSYSKDGTIDHATMYGFAQAGHGANFRLTDEIINNLKTGQDVGVANWRRGDEQAGAQPSATQPTLPKRAGLDTGSNTYSAMAKATGGYEQPGMTMATPVEGPRFDGETGGSPTVKPPAEQETPPDPTTSPGTKPPAKPGPYDDPRFPRPPLPGGHTGGTGGDYGGGGNPRPVVPPAGSGNNPSPDGSYVPPKKEEDPDTKPPGTSNNGDGPWAHAPLPFGTYPLNGRGEQIDNYFGQGSNDEFTGDAWSTSAPWRPTEPTGGLYGAFAEMAGGQLTPYENRIGEAWQGRAVDPGGWADQNYYNALAQYNASPGIGLKESYNAYNNMINSNGYSDAEKGAISGSAVRGVTAGYQRGMDDMRRQAARTGNANAAYAAMSQMSPSYGAQLGEVNRQNEIKFADEKARRNEAGASGMTNVAALGNTKAQFGLNSQQQFANEMARRQETAIRGMGDYAAYGRGLQQQGLSGMGDLYKQQNANTQNYYNMISNLLGRQVGTRMYGESSGEGINGGITGGS